MCTIITKLPEIKEFDPCTLCAFNGQCFNMMYADPLKGNKSLHTYCKENLAMHQYFTED